MVNESFEVDRASLGDATGARGGPLPGMRWYYQHRSCGTKFCSEVVFTLPTCLVDALAIAQPQEGSQGAWQPLQDDPAQV